MSYLQRVRQLLAEQDRPMSRHEIRAHFAAKKSTYVDRAVAAGLHNGLFLLGGDDMVVLNWVYLNQALIRLHPAPAPSRDA